MRVDGPNRIGQGTQGTRRTSPGSGFSLPEAEAQAPAARPTGPMAAPGLDALLALQSVDMPLERRKKAAARGRQMLDLLDQVKLGALDGTLSFATLENLRSALDGRETTDDATLETIMDEIGLRAEVELAKLTRKAG